MSGAPKTTEFLLNGPAGDLEALLDEPLDAAGVAHCAVICHPHPLFGGTMTNKVVHILARACTELGAPALRFNFRGVGKSAGSFDDGDGEAEDVLAMLAWARERWPSAQLWLLGFSFGAAMALRAAFKFPVARLVTVAPALRWLNLLERAPDCPWLIVQGDRDELVDAQAVRNWAERLSQPPQVAILEGAEHFFHGRLNDVRAAVQEWLREK